MFHKDQILQFLNASPQSFWVVDMRDKEAFDRGHIKGAIHAPWGDAFKAVLESLPTDIMMIPYCEHGEISWGAASLAQSIGLKAMSIYDGAKTLEENDYTTDLGSPELKTIRELPEQVQQILKEDFVMTAEEVKQGLDQGSLYLVDVRDEAEKESIPGSISMRELEAMDVPDKPLVFMCYSGQSSTAPAMRYKLEGHEAYSLEGGFGTDKSPRGWKHKGYPTT